jgi:hypothetical protein
MIDLLPLSQPVSRLVLVLVAVALLAAGRRLFWLAVAALGFCAGLYVADRWLAGQSQTTVLVVALAMGVLGLVLALVVQKVAVAFGGFVLGAVSTAKLLPFTSLELGPWLPLVIVAGGVVVALLALAVFGLALTVVTAGAGAALLVESVAVPPPLETLLFAGLWVLGVLLQRRAGVKARG